jgi:hypothetical protein
MTDLADRFPRPAGYPQDRVWMHFPGAGRNPDQNAWQRRAHELARYVQDALVNREDCYVLYYPEAGGVAVKTMKRPPVLSVLADHFAGRPHRAVALHAIGIAKEGDQTQRVSKWGVIDVDHHPTNENDPPPAANESAAIAWYTALKDQGYDCALEDSNGNGGFHLRVVFAQPLPTQIVFAFLARSTADWRERGLSAQPELFPSQSNSGAFGPAARLPGRNPRNTEHWSRFYDGASFVDGDAAIDIFLNVKPAELSAEELAALSAWSPPVEVPEPSPGRSFHIVTPSPTESLSDPWDVMVGPATAPTSRPGDELAEKFTWEELLIPHDWTFVGEGTWTTPDGRSGTYQKARRPGKDQGHSATIGYAGDWMKVFTDKTPFTQGETYSKFGAYAVLNAGGDFHKAAEMLRAQGLGTNSPNGQVGPSAVPEIDDDAVPLDVRAWPEPPDDKAFHGVLGQIVRAIQPQTEADPLGILAHLVAMFGNAIGRNAYVQIEGTRHHLNEFMITVGQSALSRKGTAGDWAKHVFAMVDSSWVSDHIKDGLSSGEGLVSAVKDPKEGRHPIKEKGKIVDWQSIVVDPGVSDKRLLVLETEFGGVLRALQREGNRLSALIRQAWDSGNLRSLTKDPWLSTNAHISIIGHITAAELLHLLGAIDFVNGFSNRFWWFAVRGGPPLPFGGMPDGLKDLATRLEEILKDAGTVNRIGWTDAAKDLWKGAMYSDLRELPAGQLSEILNRAAPHVLRVAGIFALADRGQVLEPPHLEAAKALWDASVRCASYIFGDKLGDPTADKLLHALREALPDGLTRKEIRENVFQRNLASARIKAALSLLITSGKVREVKETDTGGRPAHRYFWGP